MRSRIFFPYLWALLVPLLLALQALTASAASDEIDWTSGTIRVTGVGMAPPNAANPTLRREMAERAAIADGQRKLVKAIAQIKVGSDSTVGSRMGQGSFTQKIEGYVKGYRLVDEREMQDGRIEVDMELQLTGPHGLSRYLFE